MEFRKTVFIKASPLINQRNRRFFHHHVREAFIKHVAGIGGLESVLSEAEIEAAKQGKLPDDLEVHHMFPLSCAGCGDVNSFVNLTVLHRDTHAKINREIFTPQLKYISAVPIGAIVRVTLPWFDQVDVEGILQARQNACKRSWLKKYRIRQRSAVGRNRFSLSG